MTEDDPKPVRDESRNRTLTLTGVRERRTDREAPKACEVWPAPEQLHQSADLRLVAEQGPALPDKPVRGRVGLRHGVPARQIGKRQHQRRAAHEARPRVLPRRVYFLSAAFFSAGALDADFAIDVVGTMMWAYGVPFHITHGPPLVQSVGYASS